MSPRFIFLVFLAIPDSSNLFIDDFQSDRPGIEASEAGACPPSHPIKGNFTTYSGERCIYHLPGQRFYSKTKAERCYATEKEAREDTCRKSRV